MISVSPTKRMHRRGLPAGFTLIELLVVVAIISALAALTAAATVGVISAQKQSNTELTIQTLMGQLEQQWQAVIAQANQETIPPNVILMAGGDERRARVIWIKLRLKQEFPMNFTEALAPWKTALDVPVRQNPYIGPQDLPAKTSYARALATLTGSTHSPTTESAAMLLLALQQGRKGTTTFGVDNLAGSGAVADTDNDGVPELVDAWGTPLVFYRWPFGSPLGGSELNQSNPDKTGVNSRFQDPVDPHGLLLESNWNNLVTNLNTRQGVYWFEQLCHPVHMGIGDKGYTPVATYMQPVIVSAGRNKRTGLASWFPPSPQLPSALSPDPMAIFSGPDEADNIYSFRLRLGGRGGS
jgi:prepilin-type N-terminal cleavage/methylation domain-containing protein